MVHGYPKLTSMREQTKGFMKSTGVPPAMAPLAGVLEFFGGLALLIGFLVPVVGALFAIFMLGTTFFAKRKLKRPFTGMQGGYELDVILLAGAVALVLVGGGPLSIDALLRI